MPEGKPRCEPWSERPPSLFYPSQHPAPSIALHRGLCLPSSASWIFALPSRALCLLQGLVQPSKRTGCLSPTAGGRVTHSSKTGRLLPCFPLEASCGSQGSFAWKGTGRQTFRSWWNPLCLVWNHTATLWAQWLCWDDHGGNPFTLSRIYLMFVEKG